jgi:hypothetical protein
MLSDRKYFMRPVNLIAACIAILGSSVGPALAGEVHCPETVSVNQSLAKPEPGWKPGTAALPIILAGVTLFDGPPEQQASLVYDRETLLHGKQVATWRFGPNSGIWLSCQYSGTVIVLSRALPKNTTVCSVTYNPKQTVAGLPLVEKIACQ